MARRPRQTGGNTAGRPKRTKLSAKESLKRLQDFSKRKEQFVAAVRKGKDRGVSA